MQQFGGKDSKRHFTVVMGDKENGLYVSLSPSSAAKKAVTKLCTANKSKKVEFYIREITQGSKKKTYGPYVGYIEKLKEPIELKGRVIKYKPVAKLSGKTGGMFRASGGPAKPKCIHNRNYAKNKHNTFLRKIPEVSSRDRATFATGNVISLFMNEPVEILEVQTDLESGEDFGKVIKNGISGWVRMKYIQCESDQEHVRVVNSSSLNASRKLWKNAQSAQKVKLENIPNYMLENKNNSTIEFDRYSRNMRNIVSEKLKLEEEINERYHSLIFPLIKQLDELELKISFAENNANNVNKAMVESIKTELDRLYSNKAKEIKGVQYITDVVTTLKRNSELSGFNSLHSTKPSNRFGTSANSQFRSLRRPASHLAELDNSFSFSGPAQNFREEFDKFYAFVLDKARSHNITKVSNTKYIIHYGNNHNAIWELQLTEDGVPFNITETHENNSKSALASNTVFNQTDGTSANSQFRSLRHQAFSHPASHLASHLASHSTKPSNRFGTSANSQFRSLRHPASHLASHSTKPSNRFGTSANSQFRSLRHPASHLAEHELDNSFSFSGPAQYFPQEFDDFLAFVLDKAQSHKITKVSNTKYIIHYDNKHNVIWELKLLEDGTTFKNETHEYNSGINFI